MLLLTLMQQWCEKPTSAELILQSFQHLLNSSGLAIPYLLRCISIKVLTDAVKTVMTLVQGLNTSSVKT